MLGHIRNTSLSSQLEKWPGRLGLYYNLKGLLGTNTLAYLDHAKDKKKMMCCEYSLRVHVPGKLF